MTGAKKRVFVGLSGGVDSSVSAALLKKAGYDVIGAFIKTWHPEWLPCEWKDERRDAMRVAAKLDIPFVTIDLSQEYKKTVADYMIEEYKLGRTPNPDVMCNKEIKFGAFLKRAVELGADYVATGHYAINDGGQLAEGKDKNKDQSYFLWTLTSRELSKTLFPVGNLTKVEVRKLAKKFGLPTAEKKDSQGICFIGKVEMKEFLEHYIDVKRGEVLDGNGEVIGQHDGAVLYTIGERHNFQIFKKTNNDAPYYIVAKDIAANTITVSHRANGSDNGAAREVVLGSVNWIREKPIAGKQYGARIRYRQQKQKCAFDFLSDKVRVIFAEPQQGASIGQSLVVYDDNTCLGGGIIEELK